MDKFDSMSNFKQIKQMNRIFLWIKFMLPRISRIDTNYFFFINLKWGLYPSVFETIFHTETKKAMPICTAWLFKF